jgi:hypothetical protein
VGVPFFSWTFSHFHIQSPDVLFTLVLLYSSMVLPVAAVHRGVAGEADGEGDTGRSHHQGRLREQHLTSLRRWSNGPDFFYILIRGQRNTTFDNCYFQGVKSFFSRI